MASNRINDGHVGPLSMVPRAAGVAGAHTRVPANCRRWFKAADKRAKDPLMFYTRRSGSGFEEVVRLEPSWREVTVLPPKTSCVVARSPTVQLHYGAMRGGFCRRRGGP